MGDGTQKARQLPGGYEEMLAGEARYWEETPLTMEVADALVPARLQAAGNAQLTGRDTVSWFDDLLGRGPFGTAALLGGTSGYLESRWLRAGGAGGSPLLDVYELSSGVLARAERRLSDLGLLERARLVQCDLNRVELPRQQYDVIWAASTLHHLVELEHICDQVWHALRPGGLFAFYEYVGEKRVQYDPLRLRLTAEALRDVPAEYWRDDRGIRSPDAEESSPFEAIRSDELLKIAKARFHLLHWGTAGALAPAYFAVDLPRLEREAPRLVDSLIEAERRAATDGLGGCVGYGVFRR